VDLGLGVEWLSDFVASLELGAGVVVEPVDRSGIRCTRVRFELPEEAGHRHLKDVLAIVRRRELPAGVVAGSTRVFERLAEVEAAIHGVPVERVHFHEVGGLDSILDVLCAMAGVEALGYTRFFTRPVAVGRGSIEIEHGLYPLPAPATARLLEGLPVTETGYAEECTTPTGAALLAELTGGRTPPARFRWGRTGYGAGSRNPAGRPNCLRLIECRVEPEMAVAGDAGERLHVVQADIDDLAPEYVASARDPVMAAGAVDVTVVRVEMKKGRPGVRLEALVPESCLAMVVETLFRGTTTLGVRHWPVDRMVLERDEETVEWRGHMIRMKTTRVPGGGVRHKPEFDDVVAAARDAGLTPHEVRLELDAVGRGKAPDQ
jgi:pyridinium-3,5-bisthiocarboxylic acid mononucleotide nickel chelatase